MKTKYYWKFPQSKFERRESGFFLSRDKAVAEIEDRAFGIPDPWIQLVKEDDDGWEVIAEYRNHGHRGWVTPLEAMGLK